MIQSMTGFGRAHIDNDQLAVAVEVKTLNSKHADSMVKMSHVFSDKEIELRNLLSSKLTRGKIILSISYTSRRAENLKATLNRDLIKSYYADLKSVADEIGEQSNESLLPIIMEMPDVYEKESVEEVISEDWKVVKKIIEEAIAACTKYRIEEGVSLKNAFEDAINAIRNYLTLVEVRDPERIVKIKEKLNNQVKDFVDSENFDPNRFEQELIYYIEKLDISEEKVRLKNHLDYFIETISSDVANNGKKLGFIAQEIGREINTIGSKANDLEIQKLVVNMKEELEKVKEQVLNVL